MPYRNGQPPIPTALETILRSSRISRRDLLFRLLPGGLFTFLSLPLLQACTRAESPAEA